MGTYSSVDRPGECQECVSPVDLSNMADSPCTASLERGYNVHLMLMIMSDEYTNIQSNQHGTFHLGGDTSKWMQSSIGDEEVVQVVQYCPVVGVISNSWSLQNHLNCGQWFLGNHSIPLLSSSHNNDSVPIVYVPGFVRPGYEALYLERYSNFLNYDEVGRPLKHQRGPSKKTEAQGMFTGTVGTGKWTKRLKKKRKRGARIKNAPFGV